jgi:rhomboid family GlyGly-CTERM serine protease
MGLRKRREFSVRRLVAGSRNWLLPVILILTCALIAVFGEPGRTLFRYDRPAIIDGEVWRLLTGHLSHLGPSHLALNMAGLVLVWILVGRYLTASRWLLVLFVSTATASTGFWFIDEQMLWYVGLSGVLHGLIIAGGIQGLKDLPGESAVILALVTGKLIWEQVAGPLPGSESASGGTVVVNAHLYGAIGGAISALLLRRGDKAGSSI